MVTFISLCILGELSPDGASSTHLRLAGRHDEVLRPAHEGGCKDFHQVLCCYLQFSMSSVYGGGGNSAFILRPRLLPEVFS